MVLGNTFCIPLTIDDVGKSNKKQIARFKNNFVFQNTFSRFVIDGLGRYKIKGLTETMNERVMLQSLLWYGCVCIYEKGNNLLSLPCAPSGAGFNIYGDFGGARVFALNGRINEEVRLYIEGSEQSAYVSKLNGSISGKPVGVLIRENPILYPFIRHTLQYAQAVADTFRTLDTVRANIKRPFLVFAEESVVPTVKKYFEQRDMNYEEIISTGVFDPSKVVTQPIDINGSSLHDATQLVEWYENKYRELCGHQNNSQMDKKGENLVKEEITVNDYYTSWNVNRCVDQIQQGLDIVNKMYGTKLECEVRKNENLFGNYSDLSEHDTTGTTDNYI